MIVKGARLLKVSTSDGHRILINTIRKVGDQVTITVEYNKFVEQDNPPFSKKGIIKITCFRKDYQETIQKLTKYLEDLFLKGLSNENTDSSVRINNDARGNKKSTVQYTIGVDEGKGSDSSVYSSSRGKKPTKDSGRTESSSKVDKVSNKDVGGEDKSRD